MGTTQDDTCDYCWLNGRSYPLRWPKGPVPPAGSWQGDLIDQANANAEAELQIQFRQSDGSLLRTIEEALARIRRAHSESVKPAVIP